MGRNRVQGKDVFNTRIDSGILKAAKKLAIDQDKQYASLFEEALVDIIRKYNREDLIPESVQGVLFHG